MPYTFVTLKQNLWFCVICVCMCLCVCVCSGHLKPEYVHYRLFASFVAFKINRWTDCQLCFSFIVFVSFSFYYIFSPSNPLSHFRAPLLHFSRCSFPMAKERRRARKRVDDWIYVHICIKIHIMEHWKFITYQDLFYGINDWTNKGKDNETVKFYGIFPARSFGYDERERERVRKWLYVLIKRIDEIISFLS